MECSAAWRTRGSHVLVIVSFSLALAAVASEDDTCLLSLKRRSAEENVGPVHFDLAREQSTFRASDGARIGFITVSRHRTGTAGTTVLIAPGLTGTAAGFIEWFARPLLSDRTVQRVVAMDWRGYGLSTGPWGPTAPPDGPEAPSYGGLSTWRMAQDLKELIAERHLVRPLGKGKLVLLGHSMGVNVILELLSLHGMQVADGLVLLEESPKNMAVPGSVVVDPTFPSNLITFSEGQLKRWEQKYLSFNACIDIPRDAKSLNVTELKGQWQPYYQLSSALLEQFHTVDEDDEVGSRWAAKGHYFSQTTEGLLSWLHYLGPSNGKVMALEMYSAIAQDLTGIASQIREARVPFLWYGGENGLPPLGTIVWSAEAMSPCDHNANHTKDVGFGSLTSFCPGHGSTSAFELLQFDGLAGVHVPWLNVDGSAEVFMDAVNGFLSRV